MSSFEIIFYPTPPKKATKMTPQYAKTSFQPVLDISIMLAS